MIDRDPIDRHLLAEIQLKFPLTHRPFAQVGQETGLSEEACLERLSRLKRDKVIRRIGAQLDARGLGYQSTLAAFRIDPERADQAATRLIEHPGVSQCQRLNDPYNLWITLAVPPTDLLDQTLAILQQLTAADEVMALPILHLYKAGARVEPSGELLPADPDEARYDEPGAVRPKPVFSARDLALLRAVQDDLPMLEMPYIVWAEQAGVTEDELFGWIQDMERRGVIKRVAASLAHQLPGTVETLLVAWRVPEDQVDPVGQAMARSRHVYQCDRRPAYPDWPYSIYTWVHAASREECVEVVRRLEDEIGEFAHKNLVTVNDYKRAEPTYFPAELEEWWKRVGSRVAL